MRPILIAAAIFAAALASAAGLPWAKNYSAALAEAKRSKKIVMIDFTASWCVNCHKLDRTTYKDPAVVKFLANTVPVHVDYDKEQAIAKKHKSGEALPVIIFIDASGKELGRLTGYYQDRKSVV